MAEYIGVNKTIDYITKHLAWYDEDGYLVDEEEAKKKYTDLIKGIKTADVVERSKINKVIEEIEELYTEWENSTDDARLESNPFGAVLNIIQRNIAK